MTDYYKCESCGPSPPHPHTGGVGEGEVMSGYCDFCQAWHSAGCCHPGRVILAEKEIEIRTLKELLEEVGEAIAEESATITVIKNHLKDEGVDTFACNLGISWGRLTALLTRIREELGKEK